MNYYFSFFCRFGKRLIISSQYQNYGTFQQELIYFQLTQTVSKKCTLSSILKIILKLIMFSLSIYKIPNFSISWRIGFVYRRKDHKMNYFFSLSSHSQGALLCLKIFQSYFWLEILITSISLPIRVSFNIHTCRKRSSHLPMLIHSCVLIMD